MFPGPAAVNVRKTDVYGRGLKQHLQIRMAQHSETGVLNSNRESRKSNRESRKSNRESRKSNRDAEKTGNRYGTNGNRYGTNGNIDTT